MAEYKSVLIPDDLWQALKIKAAQDRTSLQDCHEAVLREALNKPREEK